MDFMAAVSRPSHMSDRDHQQVQSWMRVEGLKNWVTKVAQANEALSRVLPYRPDLVMLMPFSPDAGKRGTHEPIIQLLRQGPEPR